ncbi:MAG: hypothetical protein IJ688_03960 [Treponema sp.]|nr:hypothetical protein [Treponema sp.]
MKKNIFFTSLLLVSIFFAGCFDPVFYDIRNDVAPEEATVSGNITSITRYTVNGDEYLVLSADKGLRYKAVEDNFHGAWKDIPSAQLPYTEHSYDYFSETHNGQQLLKVLADSKTLYLLTASYKNDTALGTTVIDKIKLYGAQIQDWASVSSDSWTEIIGDDDSSTYFPTYTYSYYNYTAFSVFQTNAPQKDHRKVFIRTGDVNAYSDDYTSISYYELDGTKAPSEIEVTPEEVANKSSSTNCAYSAVWFDGKVLFFNSKASTTNETYDDEASHFYYSSSSTVYHSDEAGSVASDTLSAGEYVSALMTCSDALIIGRGNFSSSTSSNGGLKKTSLEAGIPGASLIDFETNASFQITSSYYVTALLNATPDKSELESDLYAAITYKGSGTSTSVSANNKGLWSYYPDRGNWNRE